MAATHKKLNSGVLSASNATPTNIYDPSSVKGLVKTLIFHSTDDSGVQEVNIYFNGTDDDDRIIKAELSPNETLEWSLGHILVVADSEVLKGTSGGSGGYNKVNYFIFGAEE